MRAPQPMGSPQRAPRAELRRLVIGLGNPGPEYAATRHNIGVRVVERLADSIGALLEPSPFEGRFGTGWLLPPEPAGSPGSEVLEIGLLAPTTWMNRSGSSVARVLAAHPDIDPRRDLLVVLDDLDLPFGRRRLRPRGGAGGHKGLADVL
jgi:PTH1 family peptidyl-tRNA hydrolase